MKAEKLKVPEDVVCTRRSLLIAFNFTSVSICLVYCKDPGSSLFNADFFLALQQCLLQPERMGRVVAGQLQVARHPTGEWPP